MWPLLQGEQTVYVSRVRFIIVFQPYAAALREVAAAEEACIVARGLCRIEGCHVSIACLAHVHTEGEGGEV